MTQRRQRLIPGLAASALWLASCGLPAPHLAASNAGAGASERFTLAPAVTLPASGPLPQVDVPGASFSIEATRPARTLDGKLLVLAADGHEADLPAITRLLDMLGTPYEVYVASQHPNGLVDSRLASGDRGYYQGVIVTTGNLPFYNGSAWVSALAPAEWQALWRYEARFGVRQVTWYAYPSSDMGFGPARAVDPSSAPVDARFTAAGRAAFASLNTGQGLAIANAYTYLAPAADASLAPWLVDGAGNTLVGLKAFTDGRQNLVMTFDSNPYLLHTQALGFGLVSWVCGGALLGDRQVAVCEQVDDYFLDDDIWMPGSTFGADRRETPPSADNPAPTFRLAGDDVKAFVAWQQARRADPQTATLATTLAFNGYGVSAEFLDGRPSDTLLPTTRRVQDQFFWISHTFHHENLDATDRATTTAELRDNNALAARLGLKAYTSQNLVQPDVSGLKNAQGLQAAYDTGVRFVISDTSHPDQVPATANTGIVNALVPGIFEVPRHPVNLFYNVSTPAEWVSEYNSLYRSFWGRDLGYAEVLDKTSDQLAAAMLAGDIDPWMFHQPNMRAYDGTHSLLGDLTDRTIAKFERVFVAPVWFPTQDMIGRALRARMNYLGAGVTAVFSADHSRLTLSARRACLVPLVGPRLAGSLWLGDHWLTYVPLASGQSRTLSLPASSAPGTAADARASLAALSQLFSR